MNSQHKTRKQKHHQAFDKSSISLPKNKHIRFNDDLSKDPDVLPKDEDLDLMDDLRENMHTRYDYSKGNTHSRIDDRSKNYGIIKFFKQEHDDTQQHKDKQKELKTNKKHKRKLKKGKATRRIQKFMKNTERRRVSLFLSKVCSDSGQCIGFGLEVEKIKKFFKNFKFSNYAEFDKIKRVGAPSNNGFVNEIPYKRDTYTSYAILKSAINPNSDNLYYEGFVGIFVNKLNIFFPCFLETYSVFTYQDKTLYNNLQNNRPITSLKGLKAIADINNYDSFLTSDNVNASCANSQYLSLLIQHLPRVKTIEDSATASIHDTYYFTVEFVSYLYQVYSCLGVLSDVFTHYDLHTGNILIYNITNSKDKYIKMIYHYKDGETVEFLTTDIIKIIDYGRCYFDDKEANVSSKDMLDIVLDFDKTPDCKGDGVSFGYQFLNDEFPDIGSNYYISSNKRNKSHDLRMVQNIYDDLVPMKYKEARNPASKYPISQLLKNVFENYEDYYGTPEVIKNTANQIQNVEDMHLALKNLIQNDRSFQEENDKFYKDKIQMGEFHVWLNGDTHKPVEYISTNSTKRSEFFT